VVAAVGVAIVVVVVGVVVVVIVVLAVVAVQGLVVVVVAGLVVVVMEGFGPRIQAHIEGIGLQTAPPLEDSVQEKIVGLGKHIAEGHIVHTEGIVDIDIVGTEAVRIGIGDIGIVVVDMDNAVEMVAVAVVVEIVVVVVVIVVVVIVIVVVGVVAIVHLEVSRKVGLSSPKKKSSKNDSPNVTLPQRLVTSGDE